MTKTGQTKKRRKPRKLGFDFFVIQIDDWDLSYSFGLDPERRWSGGPYWEHVSLNVQGTFLSPDKVANRQIPVTVLGRRDRQKALEEPEHTGDWTPKALGTLTVRGSYTDALLWIPYDSFAFLPLLLNEGKVKFIFMAGSELYRGFSDINSIRFEREHKEEP